MSHKILFEVTMPVTFVLAVDKDKDGDVYVKYVLNSVLPSEKEIMEAMDSTDFYKLTKKYNELENE